MTLKSFKNRLKIGFFVARGGMGHDVPTRMPPGATALEADLLETCDFWRATWGQRLGIRNDLQY